MSELWGRDVRLLSNLLSQNDRNRGSDLSTNQRSSLDRGIDLEVLIGQDNLEQALLLRFMTPVGELSVLGHPNYGSRLFELIGERNIEANRNKAKLFVLQALGDEPRVKEVLTVNVTQNRAVPTQMNIDIWLKPIDSVKPLNLVFPFSV
jgi:phage baseplate assembly protein W